MVSKFTKGFQYALGTKIQDMIDKSEPEHNLIVDVESKPTSDWNGIADIWIKKKNSETRVLNIEIEHFSGTYQANRNIEHVLNWVKSNRNRRASVLHLVNVEANICDIQCERLFQYGYQNRSARFCYDFRIYESDRKAHLKLAEKIGEDYHFLSVLWQHLFFLGFLKR